MAVKVRIPTARLVLRGVVIHTHRSANPAVPLEQVAMAVLVLQMIHPTRTEMLFSVERKNESSSNSLEVHLVISIMVVEPTLPSLAATVLMAIVN